MASNGRQKTVDVREAGRERPGEFDFFQLVRLIERLDPDAPAVGEGVDPGSETVHFASRPDLTATSGAVLEVDPHARPARVQVGFLGLADVNGPLPRPYVDRIVDRESKGDSATAAFLDIFHHRIVSLFYRVRKAHRIGHAIEAPHESPFARYILSFFGLGERRLRDRLALPDEALIAHGGLLADRRPSAAQFEQVLQERFGLDVEIEQFVPRWWALAPDQWTRLGREDGNSRLGSDSVLGRHVWDQGAGIDVVVVLSDFDEYSTWLPPSGSKYRELRDLAALCLGPRVQVDLVLLLDDAEVPGLRLGGAEAVLGQTSWLALGGRRVSSSRRYEEVSGAGRHLSGASDSEARPQ